MTQEELDALMKIGEELDDSEPEQETSVASEEKSANSATPSKENADEAADLPSWTPPEPSKEHKVVHQLDEVTRDSEEKAIEMMDRLEAIGKFFSHSEVNLESVKESVGKNVEIFTALSAKFPHIQTFKTALEHNNKALEKSDEIFKLLQQGQDEVFISMDAMQYQDIHRQKIERAVNVMRALNRYMNSLFEGTIDDNKRVSSAVHIAGDSTKDVMNDDDIEDLIASLRQNK